VRDARENRETKITARNPGGEERAKGGPTAQGTELDLSSPSDFFGVGFLLLTPSYYRRLLITPEDILNSSSEVKTFREKFIFV